MTSSERPGKARRGGGPRTAKGRAASSRNAVKHGLRAAGLRGGTAEAEALAAHLWRGPGPPPADAVEAAEAHIHVERIRRAKLQVLGEAVSVCMAAGLSARDAEAHAVAACAERLLTYGDYERRALSKRGQALERLDWL